ncbi:histidinol-phosphate aminotransferase family protein [Pseudoflavitalea sp. G-6-1-2]|uniref:pyridoxal phosphate-dependent aminotransferase n=1 Tax=Pseudoflavitalea sp. G-6-1-2 TaxID=2728841 RepID=UPI00146C2668|nr:histidinol-phosphate transaminase [Pseudoflavitalea sp. G-6-1-2]NML21276.1 histidinol-phosphate aminotransferase family protein [Pseudoflavitalea sp. G-6-1-2]
MSANRRTWLKYVGAGMAGISLLPLQSFTDTFHEQHEALDTADAVLRLSSNENPYGPSPAAIAAMTAVLKLSNRYNFDVSSDLIAAIAAKHELGADNVLVTAGSTELLDLMPRYNGTSRGSFVVSEPTFAYWGKLAEKNGFQKISVPLTADKKEDLSAMLSAMRADTTMVYLCNPNNPTGSICTTAELKAFIAEASKRVTVVVDEAYIEYTSEPSMSSLVNTNKNLVVIKTFSKIYGLAGARIGYALAHPDTIEALSQLQTWSNGDISLASRVAAMASLKDVEFTKHCRQQNDTVKAYTVEQLNRLKLKSIPSHTNFVYFSLEGYQKDYFELLKQHNVQGTYMYEPMGKWTRITVGTMEEMRRFTKVIG